MNRRKVWVLVLVLGLLLLAVGAVVVLRNVIQFQSVERHAFRESCRRRIITFEEYAEHWIIRNQLDSLEASARLLLLGDGLYIDVVTQGTILYSDHDEDLAMELIPSSIEPDAEVLKAQVQDLPTGAVEVTVPIILTGYPDSSFGIIRMAFSGDYANSQIRAYALRVTGIAMASWLGVVAILAVVGWWMQARYRVIDASVLQCGTLRIERDTCAAYLNGQALDLTPKLYDLLILFTGQPGVLLTDQDILTAIWSDSTYAASADVKQHIYLLRRKLGEAHSDPKRIIVTMKGFGYRFEPPTNGDELSSN